MVFPFANIVGAWNIPITLTYGILFIDLTGFGLSWLCFLGSGRLGCGLEYEIY